MKMKNVLAFMASLGLSFAVMAPAYAQTKAPAFGAGGVSNAKREKIKICTGGEKGVYHWGGGVIQKFANKNFEVELVTTDGALHNLELIDSGFCDAGFVQADAQRVKKAENPALSVSVELAKVMYPEYAHLVCGKNSGIDDVTDLNSKHTIALGPEGSGAHVTWRGFIAADPKKYGKDRAKGQKGPETDTRNGIRALNAVADGQIECMLFIGGLGADTIKGINPKIAENLKLATVNDWDFNDEVDQKGNSVYQFVEIPEGTYPLNPKKWVGYNNIKTVKTDALFLVNTGFADRIGNSAYEKFLDAINQSIPMIKAKAEGRVQ